MRRTPRRTDAVDPSEFLHIGSPLVRLLLASVVVTQIVFAGFNLAVAAYPFLVVVALLVFAGAVVVLADPRRGPFPLPSTCIVMAAGVLVTILVEAGLPAGWPGYAAWNFGAVAWLAFFLAFRGRVAAAWVLLALMFVVTLGWTMIVGRSPLDAIDLVIRHAGTLLMATLFRLLLTRGANRIAAFQGARLGEASAEAAAESEIDERGRQAAQLARDARPVLHRIAEGEYLDPHSTAGFLLLEATLRDGLRGRGLATPEVAAAATLARSRGVEVVLLDDRAEDLSSADAAQLTSAVLDELKQISEGRLTVRLLPAGRDVVATLVREGADGSSRRDFPATAVGIRDDLSTPVRVPTEQTYRRFIPTGHNQPPDARRHHNHRKSL